MPEGGEEMVFGQRRNSEGITARRNQRKNMPSVLGADVRVEGDIITDGDLFIGGAVKGRVVAHQLTLGEKASLTGIVEADTAVISGALVGKLTANIVTIKRTASVAAEITHVQLSVESGGGFEGYSRRVASLDKVAAKIEAEQIAAAPAVPALTHAEAAA